jgi:hypothetical protein
MPSVRQRRILGHIAINGGHTGRDVKLHRNRNDKYAGMGVGNVPFLGPEYPRFRPELEAVIRRDKHAPLRRSKPQMLMIRSAAKTDVLTFRDIVPQCGKRAQQTKGDVTVAIKSCHETLLKGTRGSKPPSVDFPLVGLVIRTRREHGFFR